MSLFGLLLVLSAAFCHATWNFFIKRINGGPELVWLFSFISVILYAPLAFYITLETQFRPGPIELGFLLGSVILHLAYFLLLQRGYRFGDLSLIYPTARATGPLLSASFAIGFLSEPANAQIVIGGITIVIGVLFLNGGLRLSSKTITTSLGFGLAAGLFIGSYTVWDAYSVSTLMIPPLILDYASGAGRSILLAPYTFKHRNRVYEHWNRHRLGVIVIAIFNALAYILVLYALTFTPVVYVAPTRELSVLITVLAGSILLGEGDLKRRLVWACVILGGVVMLATG